MLLPRLRTWATFTISLAYGAAQVNGQAATTSTTVSVSSSTTQSESATATGSSSTNLSSGTAPTTGSSSSSSSSSTATSSSASSTPSSNPAIFVSPSESTIFGLILPDDNNHDMYFTIASSTDNMWAAVGLGTNQMVGSLMFMIYTSANGQNVTFSPRIASGHSEPSFTNRIQVEVLPGTGIIDNGRIMVFSGRCSNCLNFRDGYIDYSSPSQQGIFAEGPSGWIGSDDVDAPLKYHEVYGEFTMDMKNATGPKGVPLPTITEAMFSTNNNVSTILVSFEGDKRDWGAAMHGFFMVGCWLVLLPFGVLILRGGGLPKWHGINQGISLLGVLVGTGLGIYISLYYNRSRSFTNPHQLIGIIASAGLIGQFVIGFLNHRSYSRTQRPSKLKPYHIWLGRGLITLAVINMFFGFPLALNPGSNWFLAGLVIVVVGILLLVLWWRRKYPNRNLWARSGRQGPYGPEPYRQDATGFSAPPYGGREADGGVEAQRETSNPFSDEHAAGGRYAAVGAEEEQGITSTPRNFELRELSPRPVQDGSKEASKDEGRKSPQPPGRRLAGGPSDVDLGKQQTPAEYL